MGIEVTTVSAVEAETIYECGKCLKLHIDEDDAVWCCENIQEHDGGVCHVCGELFDTADATCCTHEIRTCTQCGDRAHGDNTCCEELF